MEWGDEVKEKLANEVDSYVQKQWEAIAECREYGAWNGLKPSEEYQMLQAGLDELDEKGQKKSNVVIMNQHHLSKAGTEVFPAP
jgi:hypothetical protein